MFGPLFQKELIETSRRKRYYALRAVFATILLFALCLLMRQLDLGGIRQSLTEVRGNNRWVALPRILTTQMYASIGTHLFQYWSLATLFGVAILAPALVCGLIAGEKDGRTFETLLTTCLTDREILLGKIGSRFFILFVTLCASIPVVAMATLYGGFDLRLVIKASVIHVSVLIFVCAAGLYYSTITRKPYIALIRSYFLILIIWILIPKFGVWLIDPRGDFGVRKYLPYVTPLDALSKQMSTEERVEDDVRNVATSVTAGATKLTNLSWWSFLSRNNATVLFAMFYGCISALLFLRCRRMLREERHWVDEPRLYRWFRKAYGGMVSGVKNSVESRSERRGWGLLWRLEVASRKWFSISTYSIGEPNPIFLRDSTARVYDPEKYILSLQILLWVGLMISFEVSVLYSEKWTFYVANVGTLMQSLFMLLLLLSAILAASAFARERQYSSWELLLLTEITSRQYLSGAFLGVSQTLFPTAVLVAICAIVMGFLGDNSKMLLEWVISSIGWFGLIILVGLSQSLVSDRIFGALLRTFLALGSAVAVAVLLGEYAESLTTVIFVGVLLLLVANASMRSTIRSCLCASLTFLLAMLGKFHERAPRAFEPEYYYSGRTSMANQKSLLLFFGDDAFFVTMAGVIIVAWFRFRPKNASTSRILHRLLTVLLLFVSTGAAVHYGVFSDMTMRMSGTADEQSSLSYGFQNILTLFSVKSSSQFQWGTTEAPSTITISTVWIYVCDLLLFVILCTNFERFIGRWIPLQTNSNGQFFDRGLDSKEADRQTIERIQQALIENI